MCFLHINTTSMNTLLWKNRLEFLCSYFLWARPIDFSILAPQTFQQVTKLTLREQCGWWWCFIYLFSSWWERMFVVCVYSFNCGSINSPPSQPHPLHVCRTESWLSLSEWGKHHGIGTRDLSSWVYSHYCDVSFWLRTVISRLVPEIWLTYMCAHTYISIGVRTQ